MEKKLTDEEVLKALTYCCDGNGHCKHREDCPLRNESACTTILARYSLDLIQHQKAKIERLTKMAEVRLQDNLDTCNLLVKEEYKNAELQKQVDELKEKQVIECHGMLKGCNLVKQAVKDTAKEIYEWLMEHPIDDNFINIKKHLKEKYGVEVE